MNILYTPWRYAMALIIAVPLCLNTAWAESGIDQQQTRLLSEFIKSQLINHPELVAVKADIQSAKANLRASDQAIFNPELEIEYEETEVKSQRIGLTQTIDWGDKRGNLTASAQAELIRAQVDYEITAQRLIQDLLTQLAQYQTDQELAQLGQETLQLMTEFSDISERRYQAGDINQVDLNLAQLAKSQALIQTASTSSNVTESRETLQVILDELPASLPALPDQFSLPQLSTELEAFLQQLPQVRRQLADVEITKQQVNLRKSEKAWNPTIGISAGLEGDESLVGLNLSIPLNIRNNYGAEVTAAQHAAIAREQKMQLAYRKIRAALLITTGRYRHLLITWNNWRQHGQKNIDQQLVLIKQLWKSGDISAADYLLQLKQVLETQSSGIELRNQLWKTAFKWMNLTATIDDWLNIKLDSTEKN